MKQLIWGPPLYKTEVDINLVNALLKASKLQNIPNNEYLAGRIENEKLFDSDTKNAFKNDILIYIKKYYSLISKNENINNVGFDLESLWVNFQKCNEYNPPHTHNGDISFVIYVNIPSEIENETNFTNSFKNGSISFSYGNTTFPRIDTYDTAARFREVLQPKTVINHLPQTGDMFIFPSYLIHFVEAFTTKNVERISISGNVNLFENKIKGLI